MTALNLYGDCFGVGLLLLELNLINCALKFNSRTLKGFIGSLSGILSLNTCMNANLTTIYFVPGALVWVIATTYLIQGLCLNEASCWGVSIQRENGYIQVPQDQIVRSESFNF